MKILIVGCGGVGGYFGGRLLATENDVTFYVRTKRAQFLNENGLKIDSCRGNADLVVKTVTKDSISEQYDLILLTCKSYGLNACLDEIASAIDSNTLILPLLNGLAHYELLAQKFGMSRVLYGYCNISTGIDEAGNIKHYTAIHELTIGRDQAAMADDVYQQVLTCLKLANFNVRSSNHIWQELWEKFVFINALAGGTTLLRADIGTIVATSNGDSVIETMLNECQSIAKEAGFEVRKRADKMARGAMLQVGSTFSASMYKDMLANKEVESEALLGDMVKRAQEFELSTPLLNAAYCQLQVYSTRRNL